MPTRATLLLGGLVLFSADVVRGQGAHLVLRGRVICPDGGPAAGVTLDFVRRPLAGFDRERPASADRPFRRARSAADGSYAVHLPRGLACEMRVDVPPHARFARVLTGVAEPVEVRLERPAALVGRVTAGADACAGAEVVVWRSDAPWNRQSITADEAGRFSLTRLAPGRYIVAARPRRAACPELREVGLVAGKSTAVALRAARGVTVAGQVFDAATGKPVAGAEVGEVLVTGKRTRTDLDGRFRLSGFAGGELQVRAEGYVRCAVAEAEGELRVAMRPGHTMYGRVHTPEGRPCPGAEVVVSDGEDWLDARTDARGGFCITGLRCGVPRTLFVRAEGFALGLHALPAVAAGQGIFDCTGRPFVLREPRALRLRFRQPGGGPRAHLAFQLRYGDCEAVRTLRTYAAGVCRLEDLPPGRVHVRLDGIGVAAIDIPAGQPVKALDLFR